MDMPQKRLLCSTLWKKGKAEEAIGLLCMVFFSKENRA